MTEIETPDNPPGTEINKPILIDNIIFVFIVLIYISSFIFMVIWAVKNG